MARDFIDVVFDNFPTEDSEAKFIEVEDPQRKGIRVGQWLNRDDGLVVLRINKEDI
jgi:hypothetical protein